MCATSTNTNIIETYVDGFLILGEWKKHEKKGCLFVKYLIGMQKPFLKKLASILKKGR